MNTPHKDDHHMRVYGSVTVGAKGQIVIPKEARETLGIQPGDTLLTITKGDKAVAFINMDLEEFLEYMQEELQKCEPKPTQS